MQVYILERVDELIYHYDLHSSLPVRLDALEALYCPIYRDLSAAGAAGMVTLPKGDVTPTNFARVTIHDKLGPMERRLVYAHEIGHAILGHPGWLQLASMDRWFADRAERDAWKVAARLLIPYSAIYDFGEVDLIAMRCQVPRDLVQMSLT